MSKLIVTDVENLLEPYIIGHTKKSISKLKQPTQGKGQDE